jgi:hypothetical protein
MDEHSACRQNCSNHILPIMGNGQFGNSSFTPIFPTPQVDNLWPPTHALSKMPPIFLNPDHYILPPE